MNWRPISNAIFAALFAGSVGAGCGQPTSSATGHNPAPSVAGNPAVPTTDFGAISTSTIATSEPTTFDDPVVLASRIRLSEADQRLTDQAVEQLIATCMNQQGVDYTPADTVPDHNAYLSMIYDPPSVAELREHGYLWFAARLPASAEAAEPKVDPAYDAALHGVGEADGCGYDAVVQSGLGDYETALAPLKAAIEASLDAANTDPAVVEATTRWAECMTDVGYRFGAFDEAADAAIANGEQTEQSVDIAVADFGCRDQVGYDQAFYAAANRINDEWLDAHPEALTQLDRAAADHVARANEIVAG